MKTSFLLALLLAARLGAAMLIPPIFVRPPMFIPSPSSPSHTQPPNAPEQVQPLPPPATIPEKVELRKYSVQEIDELRGVIEMRMSRGTSYTPPPTPPTIQENPKAGSWVVSTTTSLPTISFAGTISFSGTMSGGYPNSAVEKQRSVEEQLRTAIIAGLTAADIRAEDKRKYDEAHKPASPASGFSTDQIKITPNTTTASTSRP